MALYLSSGSAARFVSVARFAAARTPTVYQGAWSCEMASLKELKTRITSVKSIKKITASMKLVAASKLTKAQQDMERVRPFWESTRGIFAGRGYEEHREDLGNVPALTAEKPLFIVLTSDRGLCGSINSSLIRAAKRLVKSNPEAKLVVCGEKGKAGLQRELADKMLLGASEIGKRRLNFADLEPVVEYIANANDYDEKVFVSNRYVSVMAFCTLQRRLQGFNKIAGKNAFEGVEFDEMVPDELLQNAYEHYIACLLYSALTENTAAELSARMSSMDNATTNAGDMLVRLSRTFNRQRQASITAELAEIISGAESIKEA